MKINAIAAMVLATLALQPSASGQPEPVPRSRPVCSADFARKLASQVEPQEYPQLYYVDRIRQPKPTLRECDQGGCYFDGERDTAVCIIPGTGKP
jgi:hypothetical protein